MTDDSNTKERWPDAAGSTIRDFRRPGRVALAVGTRSDVLGMFGQLAATEGTEVVSATEALLTNPEATTDGEIVRRLGGVGYLINVECLLWEPRWRVDLNRLLRSLARQRGIIVHWPGSLANGTFTFSEPGRRDYVTFRAMDIVVLRPRNVTFPDEWPFTIERIPA